MREHAELVVGWGMAGYFPFGRSRPPTTRGPVAMPLTEPRSILALLDAREADNRPVVVQEIPRADSDHGQVAEAAGGAGVPGTPARLEVAHAGVVTADRLASSVDGYLSKGLAAWEGHAQCAQAIVRPDGSAVLLARGVTCHLPVYYRIQPRGIRWSTNPRHLAPLRRAAGSHALVVLALDGLMAAGESPFEGVVRLEAGEYLEVTVDGQLRRRTDVLSPDRVPGRVDVGVAARGLYRAADVAAAALPRGGPTALFLSGGSDSSALFHHLDRHGIAVTAYHGRARGRGGEIASAVEQLVGGSAHRLLLCPVTRIDTAPVPTAVLSGLPTLPAPMEVELADLAARNGATSVVGGAFVDEVLTGQRAHRLSQHPFTSGSTIRLLPHYLEDLVRSPHGPIGQQARRLMRRRPYIAANALMRLVRLEGVLTPEFIDHSADRLTRVTSERLDSYRALLGHPVPTVALHGYLALRSSLEATKNSWLHYDVFGSRGLFAHHPFLDRPFVEYGLGLPQSCKEVACSFGEVLDKAAWRLAHVDVLPRACAFSTEELDIAQIYADYNAAVRDQIAAQLRDGVLAREGVLDRQGLDRMLADDRTYASRGRLLALLWAADRWAAALERAEPLDSSTDSGAVGALATGKGPA